MENQDLNRQILQDKTKNGKDRKWKERKLSSIELGKRLEKLDYRSFERTYQCAEVLEFTKAIDTNDLTLKCAWFCKNKLCSLCNWRRSMKYSYQAQEIVKKAIELYPNGRFLFLTLTVKNIDAKDLNSSLSELTKSFDRLFRRAKIQKNLLGFLRSTEVTRNQETGLYHPHIHVLLFVKSTYFKGEENYISQEEWTGLWKQSAKLNYVPVVDVRAVKPKNKTKNTKDGLIGAILETAKYPTKPIDILGETEDQKLEITDDLMKGLYRKRQIAFGKLFKTIKKELDFDDVENGDLVNVENNEDDILNVAQTVIAKWNWERKNYYIN